MVKVEEKKLQVKTNIIRTDMLLFLNKLKLFEKGKATKNKTQNITLQHNDTLFVRTKQDNDHHV